MSGLWRSTDKIHLTPLRLVGHSPNPLRVVDNDRREASWSAAVPCRFRNQFRVVKKSGTEARAFF
jgi:hypothetical protein